MSGGRITEVDDSFHPPVDDDPYWTETCFFCFDQPDRDLSLVVYPLFRPNQGVCSLAVHLWDASGIAPWEIRYSRFLWHLPMPTTDLTRLRLEGLRLTAVQPLRRYHLEYVDGDRLRLDLECDALREPVGSTTQMRGGAAGGHYDQALRVRGEVVLGGDRIAVDTFGHRDRSWYHRPDNRPRPSASVSFGAAWNGDHFLAVRPGALLGMTAPTRPPSGYLVLNGRAQALIDVARRVTSRIGGRPDKLELELADDAGRTLRLHGTARNCLAFHTSPPVFAWFSQTRWTGTGSDCTSGDCTSGDCTGGDFIGQDQEAFGMDQIARFIAGDPSATPA
ncbi:MAG TPA: hypothetical protein VNP03_20260 [Pseudonocardia sp.]|nr:hypothetical protein [Pseudonocardia sp.]